MEYKVTVRNDYSTVSSDQWVEMIVAGYLKRVDPTVQNPWGLRMMSAGKITGHQAILKFWSTTKELPPDPPVAGQ